MAEDTIIDPFDPADDARATVQTIQVVDDASQAAQDALRVRREAYVRVFSSAVASDTRLVLDDLSRFCRFHSSTFHADPRIHALLEGRREVIQRITDHITLSFADLYAKYAQGKPTE
jgi:hypothetical protein